VAEQIWRGDAVVLAMSPAASAVTSLLRHPKQLRTAAERHQLTLALGEAETRRGCLREGLRDAAEANQRAAIGVNEELRLLARDVAALGGTHTQAAPTQEGGKLHPGASHEDADQSRWNAWGEHEASRTEEAEGTTTGGFDDGLLWG